MQDQLGVNTGSRMERIMQDQLAPENYAGEGMYSTEEYAVPDPQMDPWTQGRIGREGEEWPDPRRRRR